MSTKKNLTRMFGKETDTDELKYWRDTGLQKLVDNQKVTDFVEADKDEFVTMINDRIIALGGEI